MNRIYQLKHWNYTHFRYVDTCAIQNYFGMDLWLMSNPKQAIIIYDIGYLLRPHLKNP